MFPPVTPVIKNLIFINVLVFITIFFMQRAGVPYFQYLPLYPIQSSIFQPFQFVSTMFTHFGVSHILFNMLTLYFFGPMVEQALGPRKTLIAYLVGGIFSALVYWAVYSFLIPSGFYLLGASGAVYTIIILCAIYFPNTQAGLLFLPFSIKLGILAPVLVTIDVLLLRADTGIAHLAHLGGVAMALILYAIWNRRK